MQKTFTHNWSEYWSREADDRCVWVYILTVDAENIHKNLLIHGCRKHYTWHPKITRPKAIHIRQLLIKGIQRIDVKVYTHRRISNIPLWRIESSMYSRICISMYPIPSIIEVQITYTLFLYFVQHNNLQPSMLMWKALCPAWYITSLYIQAMFN